MDNKEKIKEAIRPIIESILKEDEGYGEMIAMDPNFDKGISLIKKAWMSWKKGPATEKFMVKPGKKELLDIISSELSKELKEGRRGAYHEYRDDDTQNEKQKIGTALRNVREMLSEIEKIVDMNLRLKQETETGPDQYWKRTHRAMGRIAEKMESIARKMRQFNN